MLNHGAITPPQKNKDVSLFGSRQVFSNVVQNAIVSATIDRCSANRALPVCHHATRLNTSSATLEVELVNQEEKLKNQRAVFNLVLHDLENIRKTGANSPDNFVVNTYDGVEGFKQMLWHELKTKDEVVIFGSGKMEKLVPNRRWTEKHRAKTVEAGYKVREIINPGKKGSDFTENKEFVEKVFSKRLIPEDTLFLEHQVVIYNDTVATYCWRGDQKVGFEVVNKAYNKMMRQMFEHYWKIAK